MLLRLFLAIICLVLNSMVMAGDTNWGSIFIEDFADHPSQRFNLTPMSPPGTTVASTSTHYDKAGHTYTLKGYGGLVRPVRAGPYVEWDLSLPALSYITNSKASLDISFMFVLMDKTTAGIQIVRSEAVTNPVSIRFVEFRPNQEQPTVLRAFSSSDPDLSGNWQLRYRHGLLGLSWRSNTVGHASIERIGIPVAGVMWLQNGGEVSCDGMSLRGEPILKISETNREIRSLAANLNRETKQFLAQKNFPAALSHMSNSSVLYVQAHGENHEDSANSFANLASVLSKSGNPKPAADLLAKALAIHEQVLGTNHPHTALTRFSLGEICFSQGDTAAAKKHWTRCRDDWSTVFGSDYPLVKSLDSTLPRL
jgi:hypothetical protein